MQLTAIHKATVDNIMKRILNIVRRMIKIAELMQTSFSKEGFK